TLAVTKPSHALVFRCDHDRLLRALGHLIDNALRFAPDSTPIVLGAREDGERVRFDISDNGPGLSEETQEHLFDRTWHAAHADRAAAGLGLAIARGIAIAHGGDVELTSKKEPTSFSLWIPKAPPPKT